MQVTDVSQTKLACSHRADSQQSAAAVTTAYRITSTYSVQDAFVVREHTASANPGTEHEQECPSKNQLEPSNQREFAAYGLLTGAWVPYPPVLSDASDTLPGIPY